MTRLLGLATLSLALVVATMPPASAQEVTASPIEKIKSEADMSIAQRLDTITELQEVVETSEYLSGPHAAVLLDDLSSTRTGLESLGSLIQEADTLEALLDLVPKIATDHRVYLVLVPKTFEVLGSDVISAVTVEMVRIESDVDAAIQAVAATGFDTANVQDTFDAAVANRALAHDLAAPVAELVIDLSAADWPDPARSTLASGRESLVDAHHAARAAATGYQETIAELRRLIRS
ncbi:MAG: hypothetical protein HKN07_11465 [Acidimicrobiia bacterium]|nr:hypothetical protein [Acidimicrobiia bacterium]NNF64858.1 hypothetical protein [Acidimicrobiia bacterium]